MRSDIFVIFALCFLPALLLAHGTRAERIEGGVGIAARYDDGSPITYSEVKVYSPADRENPFQEGLTDKRGQFLFLPDERGEWRIVVDDGMGHLLTEVIVVDEDLKVDQVEHYLMPRYQGILMGISIIFGLAGIAFYFTAKGKRV